MIFKNLNSFVSVDPLVVQNNYGDETHVKLKKFFWTKKLKTLSPDGLNRQIDNNLHIQLLFILNVLALMY